MWWHARRDPELMDADVPPALRREGLLTPLLVAAVFALSIGVAYLWGSAAGQWTWLLALPAGRVAALARIECVGSRHLALTRAAKQRQGTNHDRSPRHRRQARQPTPPRPRSAAVARRVHRPGAGARQPQRVHPGGARSRRGARPRAVRRPAGPRQDDAGADHGQGAGRRLPRHLRARSSPRPAISRRC